MDPEQKAFLVDELEELRQKINQAVQEARQLERYALTLTGVIWTWLITHNSSSVTWLGWWIPCLISFLGTIRAKALYDEISTLSGYIAAKEKLFLGGSGGWESHINSEKSQLKRSIAGTAFWCLMLVSTSGGGIWLAIFH